MESKFNLLFKNISDDGVTIERNVDIVTASRHVISVIYKEKLKRDPKRTKELIAISPCFINRTNTWKLKDLGDVGKIMLVTNEGNLVPYLNLQDCIKDITEKCLFNFFVHFYDTDFVQPKDFFEEESLEILNEKFSELYYNPPSLDENIFVETHFNSGKVKVIQPQEKVEITIPLAESEVVADVMTVDGETKTEDDSMKNEWGFFDIYKALNIESNKSVAEVPEMEMVFSYTKGEEIGKLSHIKSLLRDIVYEQILYSGLNRLLSEIEHYDYELRVNYYTYEDVNEMIDVIFNRHTNLDTIEIKGDGEGNLVISSHYAGNVINERIILVTEAVYLLMLGDSSYMFTNDEKIESVKNELINYTGKGKYAKVNP